MCEGLTLLNYSIRPSYTRFAEFATQTEQFIVGVASSGEQNRAESLLVVSENVGDTSGESWSTPSFIILWVVDSLFSSGMKILDLNNEIIKEKH